MTNTELATRAGGADVELSDIDRLRLNALYRECQRLAGSTLVPTAFKGDADTVFALARYGEMYGLPPIHAVQRLYVIEGRIEPSAEVLSGMIMDAGHELRWDELSSERCTVSIRRRGADYFQTLTWTLDDARRAGLLDVWAERWVSSEGSSKKYPQRYVVGDDRGIDPAKVDSAPDWVRKLVDQDQLKRNENWRKYPGDMLAAKALRRAAKRFVSDALLALGDLGDDDGMSIDRLVAPVKAQTVPTPPDGDGGDDGDPFAAPTPEPDTDGIEDADVVTDTPPPPDDDEPVVDADAARAKAMKSLMATCGKAFPETDAPKGEKTERQRLVRHAATYAIFREHRSAADMDAADLAKVEAFVYANFLSDATVTPMRYEILDGNVVRFVQGDRHVDIPPGDVAGAAA